MKLDSLWFGNQVWGVYRLDPGLQLIHLEALTRENNFTLFVLHGEKIGNKIELLTQFAEVIKPEIYDINWDSFEENLEFLCRIKSSGVIVLYTHFQRFMEENRKEFDMFLNICNYVTREYPDHVRSRPGVKLTPLYILLQGDSKLELPVDWL